MTLVRAAALACAFGWLASIAAADEAAKRFEAMLRDDRSEAAVEFATTEYQRTKNKAWRHRVTRATLRHASKLQRHDGYEPAMGWLESRIDDEALAYQFARLCLWSGREEHGLAQLAASSLPRKQRWRAEALLLMYRYRYDEAATLAESVGETDWAEWCRGEAGLRRRLHERTSRGWRMTFVGIGLLALVVAVLGRFGPRPDAA